MKLKPAMNFSRRVAMMLSLMLIATLTAGATEFITNVMLIGGDETEISNLKATYMAQGWKIVNNDLNAGCGKTSDYIYLLYKSEENTDGVNRCYVTDFYLSNDGDYESEVTYQKRNYKLVPYTGGSHFMKVMGDLNSNARGDDIHLYYTTDPCSKSISGKGLVEAAVSGISFDATSTNAIGNNGGLIGYDLNSGAGATKKIYMHCEWNAAASPSPVSYFYSHRTGGMTKEVCRSYEPVASDNVEWYKEWYVVTSDVTINHRITVNGTVNLILCNGTTLEASKGIEVSEGNTLNIYTLDSYEDGGNLRATGENGASGIGGSVNTNGGTIKIHGGRVEATGGDGASGIGGGSNGNGGSVTVCDAYSVKTIGGSGAVGFGAGRGKSDHGTLKLDAYAIYAYDSSGDPTGYIKGPLDNVEERTRCMTVTNRSPVYYIKNYFDPGTGTLTTENKFRFGYKFTVSASNCLGSEGTESWYVYGGKLFDGQEITILGTVNLILYDGFKLRNVYGIHVPVGSTLNIYAQSEGPNVGSLEVCGGMYSAGIGGGEKSSGGKINIYGGKIIVEGGYHGAGIGGGEGGTIEEVNIYGGIVEAKSYPWGGPEAAAIGGGFNGDGGRVAIYGGSVKADGRGESPAIGAGVGGSNNGTLTLGPGVTVYDGNWNELGAGPLDNVETRTPLMSVFGNNGVPYIEYYVDEETKTLKKVKKCAFEYVEVTSDATRFGNYNESWYYLNSDVTINNRVEIKGKVHLILGDDRTLETTGGIVLFNDPGDTLLIHAQSEGEHAGMLKAWDRPSDNDPNHYPGIGTYTKYQAAGPLLIHGGTVEATGGRYCAGIGGGYEESDGGTVIVYNGTVKATGAYQSAGIGGSPRGNGGQVTIYGGTVEAVGGEDGGAGIGGGFQGDGGTVTVYGGTVNAVGETYCAGIGGGVEGDDGTLEIGEGMNVYGGDSECPMSYWAKGPLQNVEKRYRYMFATSVVLGDMNYDRKLDADDVKTVTNLIVNSSYDAKADLNNDGKIDIADIIVMLNLM